VHARAPGHLHDQVEVAPEIDGGQVHDRPDARREVGHLPLGEGEDAERSHRCGSSPAPRRAGDDVLVHQGGPSSEVAIEPSAVSTVVVMRSPAGSAPHPPRAQETLDLGLVVVVVDARAHEGVEPARGQIEA